MKNNSVKYYDDNAESFFENTVDADMSGQYQAFLREVPKGGHIFDFGCGTGRDSRYFLQQSYKVTAIDGSQRMCKMASEYIGQTVIHMLFAEIDYSKEFDGIWACASLLHVGKNEMSDLIRRLYQALKQDGILYVSYKYGIEEREKDGRLFSDYTEDALDALFSREDGWKIRDWFITGDVRADREGEKWLNVLVKKENSVADS